MPAFFENRQLAIPGDLLAEDNYLTGENTYKDGEKIYAARIGLVSYEDRKVHVVALKAFYVPIPGDLVIGKVIEVTMGGWMVDVKAPYLAVLRAGDVFDRNFRPQRDDLPSIFDVGDMILAKVVEYDRTRDPVLTVREPGLGKISRGQIVEIVPTKIPRVIGRKGSMIGMLKQETGCQITVGQNGLILIGGKTPEDEHLVLTAIRKIEQEAHTTGLTDRIAEMIRKEKGRV